MSTLNYSNLGCSCKIISAVSTSSPSSSSPAAVPVLGFIPAVVAEWTLINYLQRSWRSGEKPRETLWARNGDFRTPSRTWRPGGRLGQGGAEGGNADLLMLWRWNRINFRPDSLHILQTHLTEHCLKFAWTSLSATLCGRNVFMKIRHQVTAAVSFYQLIPSQVSPQTYRLDLIFCPLFSYRCDAVFAHWVMNDCYNWS